jgi:hypothetical protein
MHPLLQKLEPNQREGSKPRCHWLTHGPREIVAERLTNLARGHARVTGRDLWMPEGFENVEEAELNKTGLIRVSDSRDALQEWWLAVASSGTRTPNWDIASTCTVMADGAATEGLLLVEAKAHTQEFNKAKEGKILGPKATEDSHCNHDQIGECIQEANRSLSQQTASKWTLSRDRCYQMSNRFAWSWKLTELGFPVILVYLGFLNAEEMRKGDKQVPFATSDDWAKAVMGHSGGLFPDSIWDRPWSVHGRRLIPLIQSLEIAYDRPIGED